MSETTRIIRRCGEENPRTAAINRAVEESGLGFPQHCTNYPSLIGKTVIVSWTMTEGGNIVERGELATTITYLIASDGMNEVIVVGIGLDHLGAAFQHLTYDPEEKRWALDGMNAIRISAQINLA